MRPLSVTELPEFMTRFDNFKNGEIRSMKVISPYSLTITLAGQDSAREFDWITVDFEFENVNAARLIEEDKLKLIDMKDGVNIIDREGMFAFGVGECYNMASIESSTSYVISSVLKYEEGAF